MQLFLYRLNHKISMKIPIDVKFFFESVPVMAFSTVDKKGKPNVVAIASKTINAGKIWVIDTFFGKTKENLLHNNNVAIAMWKEGKGYQIKGVSKYYTQGKIFEEAKSRILKIKPRKIVKGVVEIEITEIFYISPAYGKAGKKIA